MPRTVGKKIYLLKDIWMAFAERKLKENPGWWTEYNSSNKCRHYRIGYYEGDRKVEYLSYPQYRKTIEHYFDRAKQAIIQGECINMTSAVGKICAKRVERDFRKEGQRRVDWKQTRKQPLVWNPDKQKMSYEKVIYYTNDEWCRIGWMKTNLITNETMYEFVPAGANSKGTSGFRLEFTQALKADPLLQYQYLYNPLIL